MEKKDYLEKIEEAVRIAGMERNPQKGLIAITWILIEWNRDMEERLKYMEELRYEDKSDKNREKV